MGNYRVMNILLQIYDVYLFSHLSEVISFKWISGSEMAGSSEPCMNIFKRLIH